MTIAGHRWVENLTKGNVYNAGATIIDEGCLGTARRGRQRQGNHHGLKKKRWINQNDSRPNFIGCLGSINFKG